MIGRQTHTTEPPVCKPGASEVEMVTEKLHRYKLPGIDQIPAELVQSGGRKICSEIHTLINSNWYEQWKELSTVPIYRYTEIPHSF